MTPVTERPRRSASAAGQRGRSVGKGEESSACRYPERGGHGRLMLLHGDHAPHDGRRRSRHRGRRATGHQTIAAVVRIRRRRCRCVMMVPRDLDWCWGAVRVRVHRARPQAPGQEREQHEPDAAERRDRAREASDALHQWKCSGHREGTAAGMWDEQDSRHRGGNPGGSVRKRVTARGEVARWLLRCQGEGARDRPDSIATPGARCLSRSRARTIHLNRSSCRGRPR